MLDVRFPSTEMLISHQKFEVAIYAHAPQLPMPKVKVNAFERYFVQVITLSLPDSFVLTICQSRKPHNIVEIMADAKVCRLLLFIIL